MQSATPTLYTFSISHYSEKARWALAHLGIEHDRVPQAPGPHIATAKRLGLKRGTLPYLSTPEGTAVQGSAAIVSWAESYSGQSLTPDDHAEQCRSMEARLDDTVGVHIRRYYYSEALFKQSALVRSVFARHQSLGQRLKLRVAWSAIRQLMIRGMDLGPRQREESRDIVDAELTWLDDILADGRTYLVSGELTRLDLAAASLLSPLVAPPEHPEYGGLELPPLLKREAADWHDRPTLRWVRNLYALHR